MSQQSVQLDPLESPHPVPWNWVMAMLTEIPPGAAIRQHYYRSQSLLSCDRRYAAYSRIQMQAKAEFWGSNVSSILFLENLETGDLQAVTPASPLADNPFLNNGGDPSGKISIVVPISWSKSGERLLARVFESLFCSDVASDYAVIIDRVANQISTVAPTCSQYTTAILLGWSQRDPDRVLFRTGNLGDQEWQLWAVAADGQTKPAKKDHPITFGQAVTSIWMGPQS